MVRRALSFFVVFAAACNRAPPAPPPVDSEAAKRDIARVLDDFHDAAAHSDEARYFAHFADDGVFLGTDATERWNVPAFRAYAHPHFAKGHGWSMKAARRAIALSPDGRLAWFDEDLTTQSLGPCRGSGVVALIAGEWKVEQYNLAVVVPNDRFNEVRALLSTPVRLDSKPPASASAP